MDSLKIVLINAKREEKTLKCCKEEMKKKIQARENVRVLSIFNDETVVQFTSKSQPCSKSPRAFSELT